MYVTVMLISTIIPLRRTSVIAITGQLDAPIVVSKFRYIRKLHSITVCSYVHLERWIGSFFNDARISPLISFEQVVDNEGFACYEDVFIVWRQYFKS